MTSEHIPRVTMQRWVTALMAAVALCPTAARASDFSGFLELLVIPPVSLLLVIGFIVGAVVKSREAAIFWLLLLGVGTVAALAVLLFLVTLSFNGGECATPRCSCGLAVACWGFWSWGTARSPTSSAAPARRAGPREATGARGPVRTHRARCAPSRAASTTRASSAEMRSSQSSRSPEV